MAKKAVRSKGELLAAVKKMEEDRRAQNRQCKNCKKVSFYREFPATKNFPKPAVFCGCKLKTKLVDPNGCCEAFA